MAPCSTKSASQFREETSSNTDETFACNALFRGGGCDLIGRRTHLLLEAFEMNARALLSLCAISASCLLATHVSRAYQTACEPDPGSANTSRTNRLSRLALAEGGKRTFETRRRPAFSYSRKHKELYGYPNQ